MKDSVEAEKFDEEWAITKKKRIKKKRSSVSREEQELLRALARGHAGAASSSGTSEFGTPVLGPVSVMTSAAASGNGSPSPFNQSMHGAGSNGIVTWAEFQRMKDKIAITEQMLRLIVKKTVPNGESALEKLDKKAMLKTKRRAKLLKRVSNVHMLSGLSGVTTLEASPDAIVAADSGSGAGSGDGGVLSSAATGTGTDTVSGGSGSDGDDDEPVPTERVVSSSATAEPEAVDADAGADAGADAEAAAAGDE